MGTFAQALEQRQSGPTKHQDGEENDDECGRAQDFNQLLGGKLAALVRQVQGQGIGNGSTQTWGHGETHTRSQNRRHTQFTEQTSLCNRLQEVCMFAGHIHQGV